MARSRIVDLANFQQFTAINLLSDPGHIGGPVVLPNAIQIASLWTLPDGKTGHNVLYGTVGGGFTPTSAIATALADALTTGAAWTALAAFFSADTFFSGFNLRDVRQANLPVVFGGPSAARPGTSASPALPNETAAVITLRTAKTGQQNRGRIYVPGWATNALGAGNVIAAAAVTALQNWANTIPTALSGQGITFVLGQPARSAYTGTTGTQHPARSAQTIPVTSQSVRDNHWDSQRRRGLK